MFLYICSLYEGTLATAKLNTSKINTKTRYSISPFIFRLKQIFSLKKKSIKIILLCDIGTNVTFQPGPGSGSAFPKILGSGSA